MANLQLLLDFELSFATKFSPYSTRAGLVLLLQQTAAGDGGISLFALPSRCLQNSIVSLSLSPWISFGGGGGRFDASSIIQQQQQQRPGSLA